MRNWHFRTLVSGEQTAQWAFATSSLRQQGTFRGPMEHSVNKYSPERIGATKIRIFFIIKKLSAGS